MKLPNSEIETEVLGGINEQTFSINAEDMGLVFDLLRSKLYKDPIGSICREVISNSRDANRENSKANTPVEVTIVEPNQIVSISDLSICFKDFGPGISPQRMADVFIKYAASTKRNTQKFTGGYGIGAKTPFSYTDTFSIITINQGIKFHYTAFIDESQKGKMILFSQEKSTEESGTTIIVPIKSHDRRNFEYNVIKYTQFWRVKPILRNFTNYDYNETKEKVLWKGDNVRLTSLPSNMFGGKALILVDEIPYEIESNEIQFSASSISNYLILDTTNGMLTISATRENLQYDQNTKTKLTELLTTVLSTWYDLCQDYVLKSKTIFEAFCNYKQLQERGVYDDNYLISFYNVVKQNKDQFKLKDFNFTYSKIDLTKVVNTLTHHQFFLYKTGNKKPSKSSTINYPLKEANFYYWDDCKRASNRVLTLREESDKNILLKEIPFKLNNTQLELDVKEQKKLKSEHDIGCKADLKLIKSLGISLTDLSTVTPLTIKREKKPRKEFLTIICRYISHTHIHGKIDSGTILINSKTKEVIKLLTEESVYNKVQTVYKEKDVIISINRTGKRYVDWSAEYELASAAAFFLKMPIVIVNERFEKHFTKHLTIDEALKKVPPSDLSDYLTYLSSSNYTFKNNLHLLSFLDLNQKVKDVIGGFKNKKTSMKITKEPDYADTSIKVLIKMGIKDSSTLKEVVTLVTKLDEEYPMLSWVEKRNYGSYDKKVITDLNNYIKLVDSNKKGMKLIS